MRLIVAGLFLAAMTIVGCGGEKSAEGPAGGALPKPVGGGGAAGKKLAEGRAAGELWEGNGLKMKFRWCPAGQFMMGSPKSEPERSHTVFDLQSAESNEGPVTVKLTRGFWMAQYEVTQEEWQSLMVTTITDQQVKEKGDKLYGQGARYPMYFVSYDEATEFCRELTTSEREAGRLPDGWEYRLPTEAQWEYACRAGTTTATAFGDSLSSTHANFNGNEPYNGSPKGPNLGRTCEVGSYQANAWGLHDMHGNVFELCRDWYVDTLPGGRDPEPSQGELRAAARGGGCDSYGRNCRSARRSIYTSDGERCGVGIRLAIAPSR